MDLIGRLTWASIDSANPVELAMRAQEHAEAVIRAKDAVAELQRLGILDRDGRRIRTFDSHR